MEHHSSSLSTIVRTLPFTTWGLGALILHASILLFDLSYDSGGLVSLLVLSLPVWGAMYWLPSELLFMLNSGEAVPGQWLISLGGGLMLCVVTDAIVYRLGSRRKIERPAP